jgi:hypothetical protein
VLAFAFFVSVFSTIVWLIYSGAYVSESLGDLSLFSLGLANVFSYVALVLMPVLILWMVFGYIAQFISYRNFNRNLYSLFRQMKKNQDYSDLIARIMLETEKDVRDGFVLGRFDLLISDMNELLSDILSRASMVSPEQTERLWMKVQNGGKWAFGKVVIEINNNQPYFQQRLLEKSQGDYVLAGTLLEFCSRYLSLVALFEKHDKERTFLTIVETGVFGKVFSIFAPISDEINKFREPSIVHINVDEEIKAHKREEPRVERRGQKEETKKQKPRINIFNKKKEKSEKRVEPGTLAEAVEKEEDAFTMALRRSFGSESEELEEDADEIREEPQPTPVVAVEIDEAEEEKEELFINRGILENDTKEIIPEHDHVKLPEELSNTQKALDSLKKEWSGFRSKKEKDKDSDTDERVEPEVGKPESREEDFSYPFAAWANEENYKK